MGMANGFQANDIVACIGDVYVAKYRILRVQTLTYRVEQIQIKGRYEASFVREWVDRDFVKVGKYAKNWRGEVPEEHEYEP